MITFDFFSETMQVRRKQSKIFKGMSEKNSPIQKSVRCEIILQKGRRNRNFLSKTEIVPTPQFCCEPKTALKIRSLKKNENK